MPHTQLRPLVEFTGLGVPGYEVVARYVAIKLNDACSWYAVYMHI